MGKGVHMLLADKDAIIEIDHGIEATPVMPQAPAPNYTKAALVLGMCAGAAVAAGATIGLMAAAYPEAVSLITTGSSLISLGYAAMQNWIAGSHQDATTVEGARSREAIGMSMFQLTSSAMGVGSRLSEAARSSEDTASQLAITRGLHHTEHSLTFSGRMLSNSSGLNGTAIANLSISTASTLSLAELAVTPGSVQLNSAVDAVSDGAAADAALAVQEFDLLILDLGLPSDC